MGEAEDTVSHRVLPLLPLLLLLPGLQGVQQQVQGVVTDEDTETQTEPLTTVVLGW